MLNITNDGPAVTISFYAVAGRTYKLERKIDIDVVENPPWPRISGVADLTPNITGPAAFTDPTGGDQPHAFYRVDLLP